MEKFIAAIDQGTTSTRCILFDKRGKIIMLDQREHQQIFPKPGWVEHDANEIWRRTQEVLLGVIQKSGFDSKNIAALGITNQRETTLLWEKSSGKPVYPAIVWQDTRTDEICQQLAKDNGQDRFR
ncbi:MAG: glycerol kinase, partial [Anaerolineaceae bacterium]|nr:glycerol kinase [Anaerolineaceae bacterium]